MGTSRIELFKQMLVSDPGNSTVMFGLAKEYEKAGQHEELVEMLNRYLETTDDEGNAFGMLASAYEQLDKPKRRRKLTKRVLRPLNATDTRAWPKNIE